VIIKQVDGRTWSVEGIGIVAVVAAPDAEKWALLFAHAENLLTALKALLTFCEDIVEMDGFTPEDFHVIRAAQEAVAAAERG